MAVRRSGGQAVRRSGVPPFRLTREILVMAEGITPKLGAKAHDFVLLDSIGVERRLSELVAERPVVLLFYRGDW